MRYIRWTLFLLIAVFIAANAVAIQTEAEPELETKGKVVYRITLADEIINPIALEYIESSIKKAERDGAAALLIELDTPGGLLTSTRKIVKMVMNAEVPVLVYVAPSGARAGSAGVFITLAAHVAAMAPSTNIGAAHPVALKEKRSTGDAWRDLIKALSKTKEEEKGKKKPARPAKQAKPAKETFDTMEKKILSDTEAWVRSIAAFRGRNVAWSVKAVSESVSATENEALKEDVIDFVAADANEVIRRADGRPAMLPSGTVKIETAGATIVDIPMDFRLKWLNVLAHPNIAYILLMLGFYGLMFEFTHPGIGFPGIAGAICLVLAFFGLQVLPTNYAGVALIILAILLFIAEVKVTSYGLLTLGGVVCLFFGSLILFASPYDFMRVSLPLVAAFVGATVIIAAGLVGLVVRSHRRKARTGEEGLLGEKGEVRSISKKGIKVFVHGEYWDAECEEEVAEGDEIQVAKVDGMKLTVKKT
jgi:membrane-bound serine protease (ClpP class)